MDDAVANIFETMLARGCAAVDETHGLRVDLSVSITLSGALQAQCWVECPRPVAVSLATAFMGPCEDREWDDSILLDTLGELCNMIAGGWKKRLGKQAWSADLSMPSVVRLVPESSSINRDNESVDTQDRGLRRVYAFDDEQFLVRLVGL
jgi:chemotaxis protein CheX